MPDLFYWSSFDNLIVFSIGEVHARIKFFQMNPGSHDLRPISLDCQYTILTFS